MMAFNVTINGANYVSQNRVKAFEEALQKGAPAQAHPTPAAPAIAAPASPSAPVQAKPVATKATGGNGHDNGKGHNNGHGVQGTAHLAPSVDYAHVLNSLERSLTHAFNHQRETLHVHEQYLNNESSYAAIFAQLMQQQGDLVAQGNASPQQLEATLKVLQSLSRSLEQFHDHQTETLTVHGQFLSQQAGYAQAFVELVQEHYGTILHGNGHSNGNGNGNGNGHSRPQLTASSPATAPAYGVAPETAPQPAYDVPAQVVDVSAAPEAPAAPEASAALTSIGDAAAIDVEVLTTDLLAIVSEKTGYPAEMLELDMDMEADLGIDSIKRVEILGALQDQYPALPEVEPDVLAELRTLAQVIDYMDSHTAGAVPSSRPEPAPAATAAPEPELDAAPAAGAGLDPALLQTDLLAIVSEKTGYPAEMLELDMDMEADLGIDSIKRVEILGALQDQYPELPEVEPDVLAELRTLGQIIDYMQEGVALKKV